MQYRLSAVLLATCVVMFFGLIGMAQAAGIFSVSPTVSPKSPAVDDDVIVKWKVDRTLPAGQFYSVGLVDEDLGGCAALVTHNIYRGVKKGQTVAVRFSPFQDSVNGGPLWCDAHAFVDVNIARGSHQDPKIGKLLGMVSFSFKRQP